MEEGILDRFIRTELEKVKESHGCTYLVLARISLYLLSLFMPVLILTAIYWINKTEIIEGIEKGILIGFLGFLVPVSYILSRALAEICDIVAKIAPNNDNQ